MPTASDDGHSWERRKDVCARVIAACAPDVVGLQEATLGQVEWIAAALPDHAWHGLRQDPHGHPRNAVFVHRSLAVVDRGGYWLSSTPHVTGSTGWGAKYARHVNWLVLADSSGTEWRVSNTHLDHVSRGSPGGSRSACWRRTPPPGRMRRPRCSWETSTPAPAARP